MSEQDFKFKSTIKAGSSWSDPWITVGGNDGPEWVNALRGAIQSEGVQLTHELSQQFQGQGAVVNAGAAQPAQGWGQQNQQPQQQQGQQQPQGGNQAQLHPEGKTCENCGKVLIFKKTSGGKPTWRCEDWRFNGGQPNGHTLVWIGN